MVGSSFVEVSEGPSVCQKRAIVIDIDTGHVFKSLIDLARFSQTSKALLILIAV
jgi:hypothetical protein